MGADENENLYDVIIIGGGPAGLTAAIYLARACYRVIVIEKEKFGGQITITSEVVNYPGVRKTSGSELTESMRKQAESFGAEFMLTEVKEINVEGDIKEVITERGKFKCFGILLATGAHPRMIGFAGEEEFKGHGVAYCATCDGEFFTGKEVFVVGGGFAAAEESVFLTKYASHVTILIREDDFTCAKAVAEKARNNNKITVITNVEVEEVAGDNLLRRIKYKNNKTGEVTEYSPKEGDTFGVFVFAGYEPATELVKNIADINEQGYVITDRNQKTTAEGLYAAGDVCIKSLRQVVTATGDGALAATELERYVSSMQAKTGKRPYVKTPPKKEATEETGNNENNDSKKTNIEEGIFTGEMKEQLNTIFERMERSLILRLYLDDRRVSYELKDYMNELSKITDKLRVEIADGEENHFAKFLNELPCVKVCYENGEETGMTFHGVPGGHEFTSFVLGLYNAAGPGQKLDLDIEEKIKAINRDINIKLMVSLSCTMCPELVSSAQRIAAGNGKITTDVYDINHFEKLKEKYQVMSVPCMVINDEKPVFGKKNINQLLELMEKY